MQTKRPLIACLLALLLSATLFPQLALATKSEDRAMTVKVINQSHEHADSYSKIAEAWKKAAPGSAEASALAKQGAEAFAVLDAYVTSQLQVFEERKAWYTAKGGDYLEGQDFMISKILKLNKILAEAKNTDLYKHLNP